MFLFSGKKDEGSKDFESDKEKLIYQVWKIMDINS